MLRDFRKVFKGSRGLTGSLMVVLSIGLLAYLGTAFQKTHPDSPEIVLIRAYGRDIRRRDLEREIETIVRQYQQYGMQDNLNSMMPYIEQQAMSGLMQRIMQEELAQRHGVVVTEGELREALIANLKTIPSMLDSQGMLLDTSKIRTILAYNRTSLKQMEDGVRRSLLVNKLLERAAALVPVDEVWLEEENRVRNEKIDFEAIALSPAVLAVPDPGDEVLDGFLKASGDRFQQGPRRVLQVVSVDRTHFGDSLTPDEKYLNDAYESGKSRFLELKASHILVSGTTPDELSAAEEKILKMRARIVAGADFARVAAAESDDPSAKANRGDLGWFGDGVMDKGFWDGAVALAKGEISQPVKSAFGLHLIKLHDRKERAFEDVKPQLTSEIVNERFAAKAKEKLEQIRKRVGEKGDLSAAAAALGLKAILSEPFSSDSTTVEGLEGVQNVVSQAFSMKVGQVSQTVQAHGHFAVYRVQKELPIAVPPLKEVRTKVLDGYRMEEARSGLLSKFNGAGGFIESIGPLETKNDQTFSGIQELADNPLARQTVLATPAGGVTRPVWTNDGKLWMARIKARVPAPQLSTQERIAMVKDIQSAESLKLLEAELKDLNDKGLARSGFNSLWGRFNGIYVNETALRRRAARMGGEE